MPIHDWTRVSAGTWHDFHVGWIPEIRRALNDGILPEGYYASAEQVIGPFGPDVLAMQTRDGSLNQPLYGHVGGNGTASLPNSGGIALDTAPPKTRTSFQAREPDYSLKRRVIAIRHTSGDRIVALIELVSPGNKTSREKWDSFVGKAVAALSSPLNYSKPPKNNLKITGKLRGIFAENR